MPFHTNKVLARFRFTRNPVLTNLPCHVLVSLEYSQDTQQGDIARPGISGGTVMGAAITFNVSELWIKE
jgi:hypothetical protein